MQQRPASERDQQQCSPVLDTENIRTTILIAIFTIELNCGEIAKLQRIARGLKGLHQNHGKSTNCKKTAPFAPRIGILSQSVRDQSEIHPKSWQCRHNLLQSWGSWWNCRFKAIQLQPCFAPPQVTGLQSTQNCLSFATHPRSRHNRPKNDLNQHNQTGLQLDCKTKKDCKAIGWIVLKLHGLQVNCSNCTSHRGIRTGNPLNLLQSSYFHTDCASILPQVTQHQPTTQKANRNPQSPHNPGAITKSTSNA